MEFGFVDSSNGYLGISDRFRREIQAEQSYELKFSFFWKAPRQDGIFLQGNPCLINAPKNPAALLAPIPRRRSDFL